MPTGQSTGVGQALVPYNSALANEIIPAPRQYAPSLAVPAGAMNAGVTNDSLALSGAGIQESAYLADNSFTRGIDRAFGTNLVATAHTQAAVRAAQVSQENGNATTQAMVTATQAQVTHVQATVDANQAANQSLFGFQSQDYAIQAIWNWSSSQNFYNTEVQKLNDASMGGALLTSQCLLRLQSSVQFLVWYVFAEASQGYYDVEDLNAATMAGLIAAKTDPLTYLQAVLPGYPWQENQDGTGLVGMSWLSSTDSIYRSYYWSPMPASLYDIYHLWDYTPSSGPPTRNGIDDSMQIYALLPVQF